MRLLRLNDDKNHNTFGFTCADCGIHTDSKYGGFADLDGPSFRAYYCAQCGEKYGACILKSLDELTY